MAWKRHKADSYMDTEMKSFPTEYFTLHPDESLNYALNRWLPYWQHSETHDIAQRISGYTDWKHVMITAAEKAEQEGRTENAAFFYRAAEFFMSWSDPDRPTAYMSFLRLFNQSINDIAHTRHDVPYKDGFLPAISLKAQGDTQGTIVIHGGFDSSIEEFFHIGEFLSHQGYDVILFDGPGQGGALSLHELTMTPHWEEPVATVLDHFHVSDCTLLGISLGGYLALRAAAYEPRIKRVAACDVMEDFHDCMMSRLPEKARATIDFLHKWGAAGLVNLLFNQAGKKSEFTAWGLQQALTVSGTDTPDEMLSWISQFNTRSFSGNINQDVLIMAGAEDHLVPHHQLGRQVDHLTHPRSLSTRIYTQAEQAQNHCQVGNLQLMTDEFVQWVDIRTKHTTSASLAT